MVFSTTFKYPQDEWLLKVFIANYLSQQMLKKSTRNWQSFVHNRKYYPYEVHFNKYLLSWTFDWRWDSLSHFRCKWIADVIKTMRSQSDSRRIKAIFYIVCPEAAICCDVIKRNIFALRTYFSFRFAKKRKCWWKNACVIDCRTQNIVVNFNINEFCLQPINIFNKNFVFTYSCRSFAWNW